MLIKYFHVARPGFDFTLNDYSLLIFFLLFTYTIYLYSNMDRNVNNFDNKKLSLC